MKPAYSVIFFTVASGAGYGLLALLGLVGTMHGRASSFSFALTGIVVALALITAGLLSSTLHLGRPERFWRAFSQWRSSWLSREGVLAILTYPVALLFAATWSGYLDWPRALAPLGLLTAILSVLTVYCTGMIYASLKTIPAWHTKFTVPVYLTLALATGASVLIFVSLIFNRFQVAQTIIATFSLLATVLLKHFYWKHIDAQQLPTTGEMTGLGKDVRQWEVPHTATNFIQKEMGYVVARKHAGLLRAAVLILLTLSFLALFLSLMVATWLAYLAMPLSLAASFIERWLFFAEARHVVSAYYQG